MAESKTEVLNSARGLAENISPIGVRFEVIPVEWNNALYRIRSIGGSKITELSGLYTSAKRAQTDLTAYLKRFWEMSDKKNKAA